MTVEYILPPPVEDADHISSHDAGWTPRAEPHFRLGSRRLIGATGCRIARFLPRGMFNHETIDFGRRSIFGFERRMSGGRPGRGCRTFRSGR
jgi:hypothetical protein